MVAPVNEFDLRLQGEPQRTLVSRGGIGGIILSTTANVITVDGAGAGAPGIITLVATPLNTAGTVAFSTSPQVPLTLDSTGLIATLHFSDMGTSSVVVTATLTANGIPYTDVQTISQVRIGSLGYTGALNATANNTAQGPFANRPTGADGDFYFATDTLVLYQKTGGAWSPAGTVGATLGVNVNGTASSLSTLSGTIGTYTKTGSGGGKTIYSDSGVKVYDISNALRVQLGDLSA